MGYPTRRQSPRTRGRLDLPPLPPQVLLLLLRFLSPQAVVAHQKIRFYSITRLIRFKRVTSRLFWRCCERIWMSIFYCRTPRRHHRMAPQAAGKVKEDGEDEEEIDAVGVPVSSRVLLVREELFAGGTSREEVVDGHHVRLHYRMGEGMQYDVSHLAKGLHTHRARPMGGPPTSFVFCDCRS